MRGYPDDDRSDQQRSRDAASVVGDIEYLAGRVVARLTGEHVVIQDNGSSDSMPDIRIDYTDRPAGYVEVSMDIDRRYAAMSAAVAKQRDEQGYGFPAPGLGRVWWAWTSGSCRVGKLKRELPTLLAAMQTDGEVFEIRARHEDLLRDPSPNVRRALALGIVGLASRLAGDGEHGAVKLVPQGIAGPVDVTWQVFLDWIKEVLASAKMADVRRKFAASGAPERHVFLGASFTSPWGVFYALSDEHSSIPPLPPVLPEQVTHLWVIHAQLPERCLVWFPERGWLDAERHWVTD
jgi:hypothetical protein